MCRQIDRLVDALADGEPAERLSEKLKELEEMEMTKKIQDAMKEQESRPVPEKVDDKVQEGLVHDLQNVTLTDAEPISS